ncbi:NADH dehydrogenase subunit M [Solitalea koreensis]|uniref:NADH dehydrogenase subunit M n=2 Tax=Solitalea koreensis TaxID=543615 RepID=A0A521ALA9_9SPHI|nr:NADH dehydrogenase subunit M [Solitalea koreensis]
MAGGLLAWLSGKWEPYLPRTIALISILIVFGLGLTIWISHASLSFYDNDGWIIDFKRIWIPDFGISFHLAMDGLSLIMVILTLFLGVLSILCSWDEIQERQGFYYFNLLWILAGIVGVFLATDLFLFYFFWEVMLIPMYLLIGIWGSENRIYASYKFFIFTQASGLLMLLAILGLYFINGRNTGHYSFDYFDLLNAEIAPTDAKWLMLGFLIAFVVKLPVFPFHTWLPDAHSEAPTAGSVVLAGLMLKTGAYGILRFVIPLFPQATAEIAWLAMLIGVIGIIYGAVLAFAQTDLKRLVAYTSVSHMGFIMLGAFSFNELALQGVLLQIITHGLSTGALFILAGSLKERLHTRDINKMGGLWADAPGIGTTGLIFAMASCGLPGLGNFIAEFMILMGAFKANIPLAVIATIGLVLSAIYSLRLMQKVFLGPKTDEHSIKDFSLREIIIMASLTIAIIWTGVYPQPIINTVNSSISKLKEYYSSAVMIEEPIVKKEIKYLPKSIDNDGK